MDMMNGEAGQVMNEKNEHYAAMPKSWQAENNKMMNEGYGYNDMADMANVAHPPTKMEGSKRNSQIMGNGSGSEDYNYNANRG